MSRDAEIERTFTSADDAMQGLWALHMYLKSAADLTDGQRVANSLPQGAFQMTHDWVRFYDREELVRAIRKTGIDFLLSRSSLVSLVAICEAALDRMNDRLAALCHASREEKNKKLLRWAFEFVKDTNAGSREMLQRLPETCGDLDNARRLRNSIVHDNGKYGEWYLKDVITDGWVAVQHEAEATSGGGAKEIIKLTTPRFEHFSRSHIEFMHVLHNTIQSRIFKHVDGYSYANEQKKIEWNRVLTGRDVI